MAIHGDHPRVTNQEAVNTRCHCWIERRTECHPWSGRVKYLLELGLELTFLVDLIVGNLLEGLWNTVYIDTPSSRTCWKSSFLCVSISLLSRIIDTICHFFYGPQVFRVITRVVLRETPFLYLQCCLLDVTFSTSHVFFFNHIFSWVLHQQNHVNRLRPHTWYSLFVQAKHFKNI